MADASDTGAVPEPVARALQLFVSSCESAFGPSLVSIVLFGSAVEGRLRATSDVNVIVVLSKVEPASLEAVGGAYRTAHAAIRLSAMFILESEIGVAAEAFSVKFADISTRHRVLFGPDPFARLVIDRQAAKWRLRQVLLNLILRLRGSLALSQPFEEQLVLAAAESVGPLRSCAALLLSLETGAELSPRDALISIAEAAGLQAALAIVTEARLSGSIPAGGAPSAIAAAGELATFLAGRAEALAG